MRLRHRGEDVVVVKNSSQDKTCTNSIDLAHARLSLSLLCLLAHSDASSVSWQRNGSYIETGQKAAESRQETSTNRED